MVKYQHKISIIASVIGIAASLGNIWLLTVFVFFNPYNDSRVSGVGYVLIGVLFVFALLGIVTSIRQKIASLKIKPYLMYLVFLAYLPLGLYMFLTPSIFRWIGVFTISYLVSAVLMSIDERKVSSATGK